MGSSFGAAVLRIVLNCLSFDHQDWDNLERDSMRAA